MPAVGASGAAPYLPCRLFRADTTCALSDSGPMKTDLHPDYTFVSVRLADGTEYTTRSTMTADSYAAEIDSSNHPFYTGKKTMVDTAGRVERFRRRYGNTHAGTVVAAEEAAQAEADAAAATAETALETTEA